jgi:hypothetical protein
MERTYTADTYFARLDGLFIEEDFDVVLYRSFIGATTASPGRNNCLVDI